MGTNHLARWCTTNTAAAAVIAGRAKKSFFRKKLPAKMFSHVENREEFRILDYMPCTNRQPIDLHDPLRVRRSGRNIKLFLCITMYNVRGGAHAGRARTTAVAGGIGCVLTDGGGCHVLGLGRKWQTSFGGHCVVLQSS